MKRICAAGAVVSVLMGVEGAATGEVLRPQLVDATVAPAPSYALALCEARSNDSYFGCTPMCGATLIAPNLVVTSRHCADVQQIDSLDCSTYAFGGTLKPTSSIWVTAASVVANEAKFHRGFRWFVPSARRCGHDLAFLVLEDAVSESEAVPVVPAVARNVLAGLSGRELDVFGYGGTGLDASTGTRRTRSAQLLCVGGRDECTSIPGARGLYPSEFVLDVTVCPGDSGGGAFDDEGRLLGTLARSVGPSSPCAFGVYTTFAEHSLLLAESARMAAARGGYPLPAFVEEAERQGNSDQHPVKGFGAPCDSDADCNSGRCRSFDNGLAWSCVRPCSEGCSDGDCRTVSDGEACFARDEEPSSEGGCSVVRRRPAMRGVALACLASPALAWALARRRRTARRERG